MENIGGTRSLHTTWKAANQKTAVSYDDQQVVSVRLHNFLTLCFMTCFLNAHGCLSGSPLFILESLFHPRALTAGQLSQRRWWGNTQQAVWPWNIYASLVLWLYAFWQGWHWYSQLFFFFTSAKIKDTSVCFGIDPILFLSFFEAFSLSLSTEFCNNIVFKPLGSKNVLFFSLLYKLLISSTLSPPYFIIQADRLMAASAATLI